VGLDCGDQRRLTGNGSALEALHDDALYKVTYFTFYFTICVVVFVDTKYSDESGRRSQNGVPRC